MDKPIVFFSHSSRDEKMLIKLQTILLEKTGSTIDIFLSSDGQSVPLGRNWVHRIEEALNDAKIMLVFLSPNSLQSKWIYFECGHAYSKGIRVVPIGLLGVDLNQIAPPLGLLQGFNIRNAGGLNNIIALINDEFHSTHAESFGESDYAEIFESQLMYGDAGLREYTIAVDTIELILRYHDGQLKTEINPFEIILEALDKEEIEYQSQTVGGEYDPQEQLIHIHGATFTAYERGLSIKLDPSLIAITLPILDTVLTEIIPDEIPYFPFALNFESSIGCIRTRYKLTARLYGTEVEFGNHDFLKYEDIEFKIGAGPSMNLNYKGKNLSEMKLYDLLELLFERNILWFGEGNFTVFPTVGFN